MSFYAPFRNVSFEGPFWQLGEHDECGASSPCFTDCLQELPVTMVTSCPGNSGVEVQCSKFGSEKCISLNLVQLLCTNHISHLELQDSAVTYGQIMSRVSPRKKVNSVLSCVLLVCMSAGSLFKGVEAWFKALTPVSTATTLNI